MMFVSVFPTYLGIGNIPARRQTGGETTIRLDAVQPQDLPIKTISTQGMIRYIVLNYRIHHGFTRFGQ